MSDRIRLALGCMTGTSLDGLDVAAVELGGSGANLRARVVAHEATPLGQLAARLRAVAEGRAHTAAELTGLAHEFGVFHAVALERILRGHRLTTPDLVSLHGQTVFHQPPLRSWQLINPWPVAAALGCAVCFDLRGADLALGGQGAPITPLADWVFFRHPRERRVVVNLGGFCNITLLPSDAGPGARDGIEGCDVCACNHVLDGVARRVLGRPFDPDGAAAASGVASEPAAIDLFERLTLQSRAGRSLGTGDEADAWLDAWAPDLTPADLAASAAEGVARTIAAAVRNAGGADRLILAGGGVHHRPLAARIGALVGVPAEPSDVQGVPIAAREAGAMAVLAAIAANGEAITLPRVTGRRAADGPILMHGAWINAPAPRR
ncbi:MAG: anhydro-N-acetylmuramic acid kinase [Phycisphaerales bacterium]|nr:anhydro-N-acetylmuramic acid kinase [Phycisphaerales bacterium]